MTTRHGDHLRGARNHRCKLTWDQVHAIRAEYTGTWDSLSTLKERYEVSISTMYSIVRGQTWRDGAYRPLPPPGTLKGEESPLSVLTWERVRQIRAQYADGIRSKDLAREHDLSPATISRVIHNRGWKDLAYVPPQRAEFLRGEMHHKAKLTWEDVRSIRKRFAERTWTVPDLAAEYAVSRGAIRGVVENRTWYDPAYTRSRTAWRGTNPAAKLTRYRAWEIRQRYAGGKVTQRALAEEYGITKATVYRVIYNLSWVDPEYTPPVRPLAADAA